MSPLVLGHRGAPHAICENTVPSFLEAIAQGAQGVELDVRLCATGELVVFHDANLRRLSGVNMQVARASLWSLQRVPLESGTRIPTLEQVVRALPGAFVNVEVKSDDGEPDLLARAVAREHARLSRGRALRWIVSSFDPRVLVALRALAPSIPRGMLLDPDVERGRDDTLRAQRVLPHAVHPHWSACTPEAMQAWKARGLRVNVWTVNEPATARALAKLGADALITNEPRLVGDAVRSAQ